MRIHFGAIQSSIEGEREGDKKLCSPESLVRWLLLAMVSNGSAFFCLLLDTFYGQRQRRGETKESSAMSSWGFLHSLYQILQMGTSSHLHIYIHLKVY